MLSERPLKIVVVDDNKAVLESLRALIETLGQTVYPSSTGEYAIELARERRPDLLICDIGLEGDINGYGVARTLRLNRDLQKTLLVSLSGNDQQEDRDRSMKAGFNKHVGKPISTQQIKNLIDEAWVRKIG
ncbi:MAG: response regulator [Burkholderiaceae bacterium]